MKNLMLMAVGVWVSVGLAQAQYEPLVEQKLSSLSQLEMRVQESAELSVVDKAWASQRISDNRSLLIQTVDGPLEALQRIEQKINQTNQAIAQRILAGKKAKLMGRIAMLDTTGLSSFPARRKLRAPSKVSWFNTVAWKKVDMMGSKSARNFTSWRMAFHRDPAERISAILLSAASSRA